MTTKREKLVEEELSRRIREAIKFNGSPVSIAWLVDRINEIYIDTQLEPGEDMFEWMNGTPEGFPLWKKYDITPSAIREVIYKSDKEMFYETNTLIGLYSEYQKLIYDLIIEYASSKEENRIALIEIVKYFKDLGQTSLAFLPDYPKEDYDRSIEGDIFKVIIQYSKVFNYDPVKKTISVNKKASLQEEVIRHLYNKITSNYDYTDIIRSINSSKSYFKKYQEPVTFHDLRELTSKDGILKDVNNKEISYDFLRHLEIIIQENSENHVDARSFGKRLFVFYFTGNDFPFKDAQEYISKRPIIRIHLLEWDSKLKHDQFFNVHSGNFDMWDLLRAMLPEGADLQEWVNNNIKVSYIDETDIVVPLEKCYQKLLKEYSPVLNIEDNRGNLFRVKLNELLKRTKTKAS